MADLYLPAVLKPIVESDKHFFELVGGRLGGKTKGTINISILFMLMYPDTDVIFGRASYGSMADSSYAEFEQALNALPEDIRAQFKLFKSPLRIERQGNHGTVYFIGYGGSNMSRTKSIKPSHKLSCVVLEETQELREERNLEEALASFRRNYGEQIKVFVLGNPPPQEAHWFNVYINKCRRDPDHCVVTMTWRDIVPFINDFDLKEILKTKQFDPEYYRWFYMGETTGGFGSVYPMFRASKYVISENDFRYILENTPLKVVGCIIGVDGAVTHDDTAFTPMLLLNNGQCVVGPIFYHSPKRNGVIGYHNLVQDQVVKWFDDLCSRYYLGTLREAREHVGVRLLPIYMRIDSAAPDLIQECRFFFGDRVDVGPVKKGSVMEMVGVCQSAIGNGNIFVINYGGYYDYFRNIWVKRDVNLLAEQLSQLIWNEQQTNYDPIVPNDVSDSWTYATYSWFSNVENIQWFNIVKNNNFELVTIQSIINK